MRGKRDNGNRMEQVARVIGSLIPGANRGGQQRRDTEGNNKENKEGDRGGKQDGTVIRLSGFRIPLCRVRRICCNIFIIHI